ncbi:hypothetical protein MMMB2_4714 [Mycobacterium marinum MB2]|nr:hypothetical protein MMMB2_4714 [Mycobacterium marinum MB2]
MRPATGPRPPISGKTRSSRCETSPMPWAGAALAGTRYGNGPAPTCRLSAQKPTCCVRRPGSRAMVPATSAQPKGEFSMLSRTPTTRDSLSEKAYRSPTPALALRPPSRPLDRLRRKHSPVTSACAPNSSTGPRSRLQANLPPPPPVSVASPLRRTAAGFSWSTSHETTPPTHPHLHHGTPPMEHMEHRLVLA